MSNWDYVALAYTIVWGSLAGYALLLARRVVQARRVEQQLKQGLSAADSVSEEHQNSVCDAPPGR